MFLILLTGWVGVPSAQALPNAVLGAVRRERSPLDGTDLTSVLFGQVGTAGTGLPGRWQDEGTLADARISHLLARPTIFGEDVELVRALHRGGMLESLEFTFVDAGSYFGYFKLPPDTSNALSRRQQQALMEQLLATKQVEFQKRYATASTTVRDGIVALAKGSRPKRVKIGRTRALRAEVEEWRHQGHTIRLLADGRRLIRVSVFNSPAPGRAWLDASLQDLDDRTRLDQLAAQVSHEADGTVLLPSLRPIPQGYQPYCGLNTLAMAARYLGLHLDEDWLAVAGGFQNTGSAAGSDILGLYQAVAAEAGLGMARETKLNIGAVQNTLSKGLPVVVWRRFSQERDHLHSRFADQLRREPGAKLPTPSAESERTTWPDQTAPLHASVIVGYHAARGEFLFLESWTGFDQPRRMTTAEMAATTSRAFVFER
ncbi:MAG: hypothetical protein K9N23_00770 [Akkermansiaceae bacterium]|nr:hypothetical protein [Akkermansiaceae bacterium]MCF7730183.1 hypothetical protein [Akkermansiaceae bacterium]